MRTSNTEDRALCRDRAKMRATVPSPNIPAEEVAGSAGGAHRASDTVDNRTRRDDPGRTSV